MFTGIITDVTDIINSQKIGNQLKITFIKPGAWADLELGESISTNGVCLTVADIAENEYRCQLMGETLQKSTFGKEIPKRVNLERSLQVGDRMGGHFVQGHVDCTGEVINVTEQNGRWLDISFPEEYRNLVALKSSITIDGVSLTVAKLKKNVLSVSLVEYTLDHTTLGGIKVGDQVNIEFDVLAKHLVQIMENMNAKSPKS